jgi:ribosomal protein S27E
LQEIEIDDLLTAVTESCSEIQGKLNVVETGRPIVVSMENQKFLESQASFVSGQPNNSVQKLPEPQVSDNLDLEPHKVTADPRIDASGRIKTSGSNDFGECLAESVDKSMEIPATSETIDCRRGPSKSSDVDSILNSRYSHVQIHTASTIRCGICGKECKNNRALKGHLWYWHSNQGKVRCQICQKVLATKYVLRDHINRVHGLN